MDEQTLAVILSDLIDDPRFMYAAGAQIMWIPHRADEALVQWRAVEDRSRMEILRVVSGDIYVALWDGFWREIDLSELVMLMYEPDPPHIVRLLWRAAELWMFNQSMLQNENGE